MEDMEERWKATAKNDDRQALMNLFEHLVMLWNSVDTQNVSSDRKISGWKSLNFAQEHLPSTLCLTVYLPNLDDLELG